VLEVFFSLGERVVLASSQRFLECTLKMFLKVNFKERWLV